MYCRNCGVEIPQGAALCPECGEPAVGARKEVNAKAYLIWSILVTLFCCLPLGIPAIVFASRISGCQAQGLQDDAWEYARRTRLLLIIGMICTVLVAIYSFFAFRYYAGV